VLERIELRPQDSQIRHLEGRELDVDRTLRHDGPAGALEHPCFAAHLVLLGDLHRDDARTAPCHVGRAIFPHGLPALPISRTPSSTHPQSRPAPPPAARSAPLRPAPRPSPAAVFPPRQSAACPRRFSGTAASAGWSRSPCPSRPAGNAPRTSCSVWSRPCCRR